MSFEENLITFEEAERLRFDHQVKGVTLHQLAVKHGLSIDILKQIMLRKLHDKPTVSVPAEQRFQEVEEDEQTQSDG